MRQDRQSAGATYLPQCYASGDLNNRVFCGGEMSNAGASARESPVKSKIVDLRIYLRWKRHFGDWSGTSYNDERSTSERYDMPTKTIPLEQILDDPRKAKICDAIAEDLSEL